jgi:hypothetical protein
MRHGFGFRPRLNISFHHFGAAFGRPPAIAWRPAHVKQSAIFLLIQGQSKTREGSAPGSLRLP